MNNGAYIIAAARTSVVPCGGAFRDLDYDELAVPPIEHCLAQAGASADQVDELIMSNALGAGGNPARVTVLAAGLPQSVAGLSIDRQCVGGLDAILLATALIESGRAEMVLAGGSESYSLRPERSFRSRWSAAPSPRHQARFTPWTDIDPDMAVAANALAEKMGISADRQNNWAIDSHEKARAADRSTSEISNPVAIHVENDPFTRRLTPKICARAPKIAGTINAANTSVAADGAAFVLVVSDSVRKLLGPGFALRIVDGMTLGGDPELPGIAPVEAIRTVLARNDLEVLSITALELMEAYAVQAIVCAQEAGLDTGRINQGGGSLARGHPVGASGTILAVRLFHDLQRNEGIGLAAIAAAGGLGTALLAEAVRG